MFKVVFYIEPEWAFGSIHYELAKRLWAHGIDCCLLPWNRAYSLDELRELDSTTDLYITNQHGYRHLVNVFRTVAPEKCCVVAHAESDIEELITHHGTDEYNRPKKYGAVSNWLIDRSAELGVTRPATLLPLGINFNRFYAPPAKTLTSIGYGGTYHERPDPAAEENYITHIAKLKRSYLIRELAEKLGLEFKIAQRYHNSYVTMSGFYRTVDCVVVASTKEGAGLPALEAAAAGRLVLTPPVGHWREKIGAAGSIALPISEPQLIVAAENALTFYKNDPKEFATKCEQIQDHARSYDWDCCIEPWIKFILE